MTDKPTREDVESVPGRPSPDCDWPDQECRICDHKGCGWCPDCSPGVPDWVDE